MSLRDILVHVDKSRHCEQRVGLAIKLAKQHDARLFALFSQTDSSVLGISTDRDKRGKKHKKAADAACSQFQKMAEKGGVEMQWHTAKFATSFDMVHDQLLDCARHMDLAIVGQHDPDKADGTIPPDLAEELVVECGRPVLIVPYAGHFKHVGKRVMVAWNTGRQSVRAINDAIPLLQDAKKVQVYALNPGKRKRYRCEIPAIDIINHLARHGIKAKKEHLNTKGLDPSNTLLSLAADESIDMLVMGAYGHHRLRERLLGGVTRDILHHMTVPVLMSH